MSELHPISLDSIELSALLASWICHDIISPAGATYLALEVLEDELGEPTGEEAFRSAKESAGKTSTKLQFCRLAFGASGSLAAGADTGEAARLAIAYAEIEKIALSWEGPRLILPKNQIKLMLNLMLLGLDAASRGGKVHVVIAEAAGKPHIRLTATGDRNRFPKGTDTFLKGLIEKDAVIDPRSTQPYFTWLLAQSVGVDITVYREGEGVILEAKAKSA